MVLTWLSLNISVPVQEFINGSSPVLRLVVTLTSADLVPSRTISDTSIKVQLFLL